MTSYNSKWQKVIEDLQQEPGTWKIVAQNVSPSVVQRLRELGAEVDANPSAPRGGSYSRYTIAARWPTPQNEEDRITAALGALAPKLRDARTDLEQADDEYRDHKRLLNRSAYRKRRAQEKLTPLQEQHDLLVSQQKLISKKLNKEKK